MPIINLHTHSVYKSVVANKDAQRNNRDELASIIEGAIEQNKLDQKKLYERYYNLIFSICLRYANQRSEASSFVNLCFLKIFNSLEKYENRGAFEGWICKLSVRECIDQIRSRMRYESRITELDHTIEKSVDGSIVDQLALEDLYKIIQELPDAFQTVFCLYIIEGYKHQEIAELLEISAGTSRWYLAKAKEQLKEKLKSYE